MKAFIKDALYIKKKFVQDKASLNKHFKFIRYEHKVCPLCGERPSIKNVCTYCQNPQVFKLWSLVDIDGKAYYRLPKGCLKKIFTLYNLEKDDVLDKRKKHKLDYKIKWTGSLRDGSKIDGMKTADQKSIIEAWLKKKYGLIECPPRTGKTVIGCNIAIRLGCKTLIMAHQEDLLNNFLITLKGDADTPAMTNIPKLEKKFGRPIAGIVNKLSDLKKYDIALVNYQKFIRNPKTLKYIIGKFGFLIIDEVHMGNAKAYRTLLSKLDCKYNLGLTATPERKDQLNFIIEHLIGPVVVRTQSTSMLPLLSLIKTNIGGDKKYRSWHYAMKFLAENVDRQNIIVRNVFQDLRAGHDCIIIPVDWKKHAFKLQQAIEKQAKINKVKRKEKYGKDFVMIFHRGVDRNKILKDIDSGKIKVIIAIRSMFKQGINLYKPSMLYSLIPTNNPAMFYQLANRVCTPYKGKDQPEVKIFLDDLPMSKGCYKSLFTKEILPRLSSKKGNKPRYLMRDESYKESLNLIKQKVESKYKPLVFKGYL